MIEYGSVCSGIEAATVAWSPLGFKAAWLAEVDAFPSSLLAHHYPSVMNHGDMTMLPSMVSGNDIAAPDILVGGTPCQSFSVAGMRRGLSDDRGQLTISFVELADAIDDVRKRNGKCGSVVVWENVPGVLSAKDNAFGCFLGALAGEDCELKPSGERWANAGYVLGPKRAIAWRVLDAQYFGLAQRRKRVFVVASARDGFCPAKVLFEFDGVRRDTAPSREAGEDVAGNVGAGVKTASGGWPADIESTLNAAFGSKLGLENQHIDGGAPLLVPAKAFGVPGNWIGRKPENGGNSTQFMHEIAPAQTATDKHGVIAFNSRQDPVSGDVFGALDTCSPQAQAVAYGCAPTKLNDVVNTITASYGQGGVDLETKPLALVTAIADDVTPKISEEIGFTLSATDYKCPQAVHSTSVRRLTPTECERLQGFPDNYSQIPWRNKPADECPDGHRYKALGNSMAVPVMRWIGERIKKEITNE